MIFMQNPHMINKLFNVFKDKFAQQPILQSLAIIVLALIVILFEWIIALAGLFRLTPNFSWEALAMAVFLYALFNNILSLSSNNPNQYWIFSIFGFILLITVLSAFAYLISGVFITELEIFMNILIVFCIGYFIIASIVRMIRFLLEWAKRQDDWEKH